MGLFRSIHAQRRLARVPNALPRPVIETLEPRLLLDAANPLADMPLGVPGTMTVINDRDPWYLLEALLADSPGMEVTDVALRSNSGDGGMSSGIFVNNSDVYGMGTYGIVLSTGNAADYSSGTNSSTGNNTSYGIPATADQELLLDPITGGTYNHWDVTQLEITFNLLPGYQDLSFMVVFGSEEYPEFVGSSFVDGFGLYINGTNIAEVGGSPVNINHSDMAVVAGTELDGVLAPSGNPVLVFETTLDEGSSGNVLTFIIADTTDSILDSTVFFSTLTANPAPTGDDLAIETSQDTPIAGQATASDPQNDPLTFAVEDDPAHGVVNMLADGSFTYVPDLGFYGVDSFTFIANDGEYDSPEATVIVTVNDAPTADDLVWDTDEDTPAEGQTVGNDVQPQDLTYSLVTGPAAGTLVFNDDGSFLYTPLDNVNGTDSFTFQVNDGLVDSNVATVSITVNPINDAPSADDQTVQAELSAGSLSVVITLTGSDLETDSGDLIFTITQDPTDGTYVQAGNQITYTADAGFSGVDTFSFTVTDTGDPAGGDQGWGFAAALDSATAATVTIGVPEVTAFLPDGSLTLTTDDGAEVNLAITGPGTGLAYSFTGLGFEGETEISQILLTGTSTDSRFSISSGGSVSVGDVIVQNGSLFSIDARSVDIVGDVELANGSLVMGTFRNLSDGTLTVGLVPTTGSLRRLTLQQASDYNIASAAPIWSLRAVDWTNDDGVEDVITAPWVRVIRATGRRANARRSLVASAGNFDAGLVLSGAGLPADSWVLTSANIAGTIRNATWQVTGPVKMLKASGGMEDATINLDHDPTSSVPGLLRAELGILNDSNIFSSGDLGRIRLGGMSGSNLFAGVIGWLDGDGLPDPYTQVDAPIALGGTGQHATIQTVNVRAGRAAGWYVDSFANSNIAAFDVGLVRIRNTGAADTGVPFGISAWQATRIIYTDRDRTRNWTWPDNKGTVLASDTDMAVELAILGVGSMSPGERVIRDRLGDGGFAHTDITQVNLRALSGWLYVGIATSEPLEDLFDEGVSVRVKLDTNADFLTVLDQADSASDYYIDWTMDDDDIRVWTGGGYVLPTNWTEIAAPTAYSLITDNGVVLSVPLTSFDSALRTDPGYEYMKVVQATIWKDFAVADSAG